MVEIEIHGTVHSVSGLELTGEGLGNTAAIGAQVLVAGRIRGEIVGLEGSRFRVLPYGTWEGVSAGADIRLLGEEACIRPSLEWQGRVLDAFAAPMDRMPLPDGPSDYRLRASPPEAFGRRRVGPKLETGVKAIDVFVPLCRGQRMGIFAGSGVGKSTLMAMLARQSEVDIVVMALVGERGREVQDFIERDLGKDGLARTVLVVATSDQPPLTRRQAAWTATAIAEFFRDQGKHVLLLMDSVTRFAMAQREIGLAAGEPPTTKGYTPTIFSELPRMLERSGPGNSARGQGDISAIYTVLVEGDDLSEPISDSVRGILDGHIILDRRIAEKGRYPAIDLQRSISRMLPHCHIRAERAIMAAARRGIAIHAENEDLIKVGAYRPGTDPESDMAASFAPLAEQFLSQKLDHPQSSAESFAQLYGMLTEAGYAIDPAELSAQ